MSAAGVIAIVLFIVFLVGIAAGVVVVIAMSARRADKTARRTGPAARPPERWPYLSETDPDDQWPDEPPWRQARGGR